MHVAVPLQASTASTLEYYIPSTAYPHCLSRNLSKLQQYSACHLGWGLQDVWTADLQADGHIRYALVRAH